MRTYVESKLVVGLGFVELGVAQRVVNGLPAEGGEDFEALHVSACEILGGQLVDELNHSCKREE